MWGVLVRVGFKLEVSSLRFIVLEVLYNFDAKFECILYSRVLRSKSYH